MKWRGDCRVDVKQGIVLTFQDETWQSDEGWAKLLAHSDWQWDHPGHVVWVLVECDDGEGE